MENSELNSRIYASEEIGRKYFENVAPKLFKNIKSIKFSENPIERFDCIVVGDKVYMIEIKVRNINSYQYDTIMIEPDKHSYLMSRVSDGYIPLYVNFFNDGVCLIFDLIRIGSELEEKTVKTDKITVNPSAGKKYQKRLYLKTSDAISKKYK